MKQISEQLRNLIREIKKIPIQKSTYKHNAYLLGTQNYFQSATHVNKDFHEIAYRLMQTFRNRLKSAGKYGPPIKANATYKKLNKNNYKTYNIAGAYLYQMYKRKMICALAKTYVSIQVRGERKSTITLRLIFVQKSLEWLPKFLIIRI